jgi:hypothetical protein
LGEVQKSGVVMNENMNISLEKLDKVIKVCFELHQQAGIKGRSEKQLEEIGQSLLGLSMQAQAMLEAAKGEKKLLWWEEVKQDYEDATSLAVEYLKEYVESSRA